MSKSGAKYEIAEPAQEDVDSIFEYSVKSFGLAQTQIYMMQMAETIRFISENQKVGKARSEIKVGLYSMVFNSHLIFYRILGTKIKVIRVLHGSRDLTEDSWFK
jgi:toxin ParE1/3/4